ncbi:MAG: sigma-70 family RNA polymerase sigma factor [Firmicutes bacterium]|nr:sigma-70 family RNA polymerase sigma factor [Bacillota bacterium]
MQSMEEIYRQHAQTVYRYLCSLTGDEDLSEELTQETFAQAVSSIGRFDGSCKVSTWLCAIAKNQLMAYRRRHPLQDSLDELAETGASPVGTAPSPEEETVAAERKRRLYAAIHDSPEPAREVLYLRLLGGLSFREIGDVLGQSENWARVTFYRGKEKLKGKVRDDEE